MVEATGSITRFPRRAISLQLCIIAAFICISKQPATFYISAPQIRGNFTFEIFYWKILPKQLFVEFEIKNTITAFWEIQVQYLPITLYGQYANLEPLNQGQLSAIQAAAADGNLWELFFT